MEFDTRTASIQHAKYLREDAVNRIRNQMELAQSVLRGLTICNGGAIIGMLTFIGNGSKVAAHIDERAIFFAFLSFILGLVMALATYVVGYVIQSYFLTSSMHEAWTIENQIIGTSEQYDHLKPYQVGSRLEFLGIGLTTSSLVCFAAGAFIGLSGMV